MATISISKYWVMVASIKQSLKKSIWLFLWLQTDWNLSINIPNGKLALLCRCRRPGDIIYADIDRNDTITTADRTYLGHLSSPYSFGASFNIGYKGFDLIIEGQGVAGNMIYTQRRTSNFATLNYETNRLNAWTEAGSTNIEPILDATRGNNFLMSSYYLEPGDYFQITNYSIGILIQYFTKKKLLNRPEYI